MRTSRSIRHVTSISTQKSVIDEIFDYRLCDSSLKSDIVHFSNPSIFPLNLAATVYCKVYTRYVFSGYAFSTFCVLPHLLSSKLSGVNHLTLTQSSPVTCFVIAFLDLGIYNDQTDQTNSLILQDVDIGSFKI